MRAYTDAEAVIQGDQVVLRKQGQKITLRRIAGAGIWSITAATPPTAAEKQNTQFRAVVLTIPKAEQLSAVVEIRP